jgi:Secretion system C-terminal sorting domain
MKKYILLCLLPLLYVKVNSQTCPNQTNIALTNVCGLYGDGNGNSNWNWELNNPNDPLYCNNWYAQTSVSGFLTRMGSPFVNPGTGKLKIITDAQDYTKAKGWELLQRKFGCYATIENPYFVLYNKYTGMIRVYVYTTNGSFSQIMMKIKSVTQVRPAMLSQANDLMYAPDKYFKNADIGSNDDEVLVSISDASGNLNWSVGEFYTTLDPNIAESIYENASLEFSVYGVTNSTLKASIKGVSASSTNADDLKDGMFIKKNAASSGSNFNFTATNEKVTKFSKELSGFVDGINKTATGIIQNLTPILSTTSGFKIKLWATSNKIVAATSNTGEFKKAVNKITGYLGTAGDVLNLAGKIVGFFESTPGGAAPAPSFTNYNLTLSGTITSQVVVSNFVIKIPATTAAATNANNATYYNCNLGTFNLRTTPIVDTLNYLRRALLPGTLNPKFVPKAISYVSYRLKNDVELVVNKGAGLELVKVEGALAAYTTQPLSQIQGSSPLTLNPLERHPTRGNYNYFNHMYADILANRLIVSDYNISNEEYHTIQTPFYDLKCMKNASINITSTSMKLFLRVRATLRRTNDPAGELLYYVNDYEVDKVAGDPADIPIDISYNLSAFPPYRSYMIPPNVEAILNTSNASATPATDDFIVPITSGGNSIINVANLRYNHSIRTSTNYYTRIVPPQTNGAVTFRAGAYVELNPKFEATYGSTFLATTDFGYIGLPCNNTYDLQEYQNPGNCYNANINAQKTAPVENLLEGTVELKTKVYPNPANDYIIVTPKHIGGLKEVFVYDANGTSLNISYEKNSNNIKINTSKLVSGSYIIKLQSEKDVEVLRFQVIK